MAASNSPVEIMRNSICCGPFMTHPSYSTFSIHPFSKMPQHELKKMLPHISGCYLAISNLAIKENDSEGF